MSSVRQAAVAGSFYPADAEALRDQVEALLAKAQSPQVDVDPRALIVPHAGYVYSGPVAAVAYTLLQKQSWERSRVVLIGPSHFVHFSGVASVGADGLQTPLGVVPIDTQLNRIAETHSAVTPLAEAHRREHSLEVQLPFLQVTLSEPTVTPLATGDVAALETAAVLSDLLDELDVLAVISSDLSHYLDYGTAQRRDAATADAITALNWEALRRDDACGRTAVQAVLIAADDRGWSCRPLILANSGDMAGSRDRVVGYGAFVLGPAA